MKKENLYDFKKRLLTVHESGVRNEGRMKSANEYQLENGAIIRIRGNATEVIKTAAEDFADYLKTSLEVYSYVVSCPGEKAAVTVDIADDAGIDMGEVASYRGFMICTDENGINIYGYDERGAAQALYYLEDLMTFEKAPVVTFGEIKKKPLFSPQMIHSGYGLDEYPDEYLARVAHEGRDAILVFTKGVNETPSGYLDFNDLIRRAGKYGLDVYAYSYMVSNMSPEAPEAEEFYENTYGRLFRECPGLKGVTLVGESVEFPSKDPHVAKGRYFETAVDGIPSDKPSAGWYPCYDYPIWLNLLKKIVRKYNENADIVFWTYNWGGQPEEARLKLIESLPTDISLQATFEMFEEIKYGQSIGVCQDYTLAIEGPGAYFISEAMVAKKRGIRLYSMTNTGGRTWDFGTAPYEPMPYQWIKRYDAMRTAHEEWGLCGIMETHHYGFYPSFISRLSKHCFLEPRCDMQEVLKKILISEFGLENYDNVDNALEKFSEGIRYCTPTAADQYGAYRVGPAYPFCFGTVIKIPEYEGAMHGNRIVSETYMNIPMSEISPLGMRIREEIISQEKMLSLYEEGMHFLNNAPLENEKLNQLKNLCHFLVNCCKTGIGAKKWHTLICKMNVADTKEELAGIFDEMEIILNKEIQNAMDTIPLVEADSLLGFEPSMLYMTDRWHLEWKIRQVRYVIDKELKDYRKALEI